MQNELQLKDAYAFIKSRDPRFDGRFYWGVKTTKVYCRPTCSANPKIENIKIYKSKAEAENAGLRPCMRCRPDLSPTSPMWGGTAAIVSRALRIMDSDLQFGSLNKLAQKLGISDRHLRRLFEEHLGASPMDVALSSRLHTARQLLSETKISVTEIAFASGFNSLRRFNDAFKKRYKNNPSTYRKQPVKNEYKDCVKLKLSYFRPFDWDYIINFFENHQADGGEYIENKTYHRVLRIESRYVTISVSDMGGYLELLVRGAKASDLKLIVKKVRSAFDLDHNPAIISEDKEIIKKIKKWEGHRIPGSFDSFETAVSIILGQLVSTEQAKRKIKKLMELAGTPVCMSDPRLFRVFPSPEAVLKVDLSQLGITKIRAQAIRSLSEMVLNREIDLSTSASIMETREKLLSVKGIGPWTVEMIAMRCLQDTNSYPEKDLIIHRAITSMKIQSHKWEPWRAYLTLWIWKNFAQKLTFKKVKK